MRSSTGQSEGEEGKEGHFCQGGSEGLGKPLRPGKERLKGEGESCPPTLGFMMSDSACAFPSLGQWPIESGVRLERLDLGKEKVLVPGL